jgi:hypothetical protein
MACVEMSKEWKKMADIANKVKRILIKIGFEDEESVERFAWSLSE